jgi:hypothetical protein
VHPFWLSLKKNKFGWGHGELTREGKEGEGGEEQAAWQTGLDCGEEEGEGGAIGKLHEGARSPVFVVLYVMLGEEEKEERERRKKKEEKEEKMWKIF